ncbi:MAG: DMT family transporter, partial [Anaerolineae bacterium]
MSIRKGWFFGILSYLLMGVNPPLAKWLLENGMDPGSLLTIRFLMGTFIYFVFLSSTQFSVPKGEEKPLDPKGRNIAITAGLLNGVNLIFYFSSLQYLSASITSVMAGAFYLVFTIVVLAVLGERLTGLKLFRLGLGLAGIYFLVDPSGNGAVDPWGLFLVTGASLTFTFQLIIVQYYLKSYNIWHISQIMVSCATVLPLGLWLFQG